MIIELLAIFGLAFAIKELDGPFSIVSSIRNKLMNNKFVGVFFYELFSCYFCVGFHCGYIVYLLRTSFKDWHFGYLILWSFAGGIFSILMNTLLEYLINKKEDNNADL